MKAGRFDRNHRLSRASGFTMVEMVVVIAIIATLVAIAVPQALNMEHSFRLHNAATEFTSVIQQARMRSVRDSNAYPVRYVDLAPITEAYVDISKNSTLDHTCASSTGTDCDPMVSWNAEVTPQALGTANAAVDVAGLKTLVLAGASSAGVTFLDGYDIVNSPITFSPMGIPCITNGTTVCNTASTSAKEGGTVVAYYIFFENTASKKWEAVTVTPAGKIQKWGYSGSSWVQL